MTSCWRQKQDRRLDPYLVKEGGAVHGRLFGDWWAAAEGFGDHSIVVGHSQCTFVHIHLLFQQSAWGTTYREQRWKQRSTGLVVAMGSGRRWPLGCKEQRHHEPELLPSPTTTLHTYDWALLALFLFTLATVPSASPLEAQSSITLFLRMNFPCFPCFNVLASFLQATILKGLPNDMTWVNPHIVATSCQEALGLVSCVWVTLTVVSTSKRVHDCFYLPTMHNTIWHFYINVLLSVSLIHEFCTHSLYHVYGHLWTLVGGQKTWLCWQGPIQVDKSGHCLLVGPDTEKQLWCIWCYALQLCVFVDSGIKTTP